MTHDGGAHWTARPDVARPELDFGRSAAVLPGGVAFVLLSRGGDQHGRLLATTDAGRTWRIVHRWD